MSVQKLIPFIEYQLVEFRTIFPTVNRVLDHLFYVVGNGYGWDRESGMPVYIEYNTNGKRSAKKKYKCIDTFPANTAKVWNKLITEVRTKEDGYFEIHRKVFTEIYSDSPDKLTEFLVQHQREMEAVVPITLTPEHFTVASLLAQNSLGKDGNWVPRQRPYPVSDYSAINFINENSPQWFIRLALASLKAWQLYLTKDIALGNTDETDDVEFTLVGTKKIIQTLRGLQIKIEALLKFEIGDTVRVVCDDPDWRYSGCARPKIGMCGTIVPIESMYAAETVGKVGVAFKEKTLGYEESDKGDITLFLPAFQLAVV